MMSMIGRQFGLLTVLAGAAKPVRRKGTGRYWLCRCSCGPEKVIHGASLRSGRTTSCGCVGRSRLLENRKTVEVKNETGHRYGKLLVVSRVGTNKHGKAIWLCQCDCGASTKVVGCSLRRGLTRSCGCLHHDVVALAPGEAAFNIYLRGLKRGAKDRGYEFVLTREKVRELTRHPCHYCGAAPLHKCQWQNAKGNTGNGAFVYNGLDRVDNTKGYTAENVVPCCGQCNRAKTDMTLSEFIGWVQAVCQRHDNGRSQAFDD